MMKEKLKKLAVKKAFVVGSLAATLALTGAGIASADGGPGANGPFNHGSVQNQNESQPWQKNQGGQERNNQQDYNNQNDYGQQNQAQGQNWQNHGQANSGQQSDQKDHNNDWNNRNNDNRDHHSHNDHGDHNYRSETTLYGKVESTDSNEITVQANNGRTYSVDTSNVDASNQNGDSMRASDINTGDHVMVSGRKSGDEIYAQTLQDFDQS